MWWLDLSPFSCCKKNNLKNIILGLWYEIRPNVTTRENSGIFNLIHFYTSHGCLCSSLLIRCWYGCSTTFHMLLGAVFLSIRIWMCVRPFFIDTIKMIFNIFIYYELEHVPLQKGETIRKIILYKIMVLVIFKWKLWGLTYFRLVEQGPFLLLGLCFRSLFNIKRSFYF